MLFQANDAQSRGENNISAEIEYFLISSLAVGGSVIARDCNCVIVCNHRVASGFRLLYSDGISQRPPCIIHQAY